MALDDDLVESDLNNMSVAYELAREAMMPFITEELAAPALTAVVESNIKSLLERNPQFAVICSYNMTATAELAMCIMHTLFTGIEWGKAGREFYAVPSHEACNDPSHDHHVSRQN